MKNLLPKKRKEITRYRSTGNFNPSNFMSTQLDNDLDLSFDDNYFQSNLPHYYRSILKQFRKISKGFVNFNLVSGVIFLLELSIFLFFLPFLSRSALLAFALGSLSLTCFSYFVLLFYFQAKKPEQFVELKKNFLQSCQQLIPLPPGIAQHHLPIAEAFSRLAHYLHDFESNFYKIPSFLQFLSPLISRFSTFCYGNDVFKIKQLFLQASIDEHLKQIRSTPTDLEVHASLANTYVALSKLYSDCREKKLQSLCDEKFKAYSQLAIEEFKILSHYAPNDPWIHEQLSLGYRDLCMHDEEIKEIELLLKLRPQDKEILYRLGMIYFQQGLNAKGLQAYEELKQANFKKAEDLISSYGIITP